MKFGSNSPTASSVRQKWCGATSHVTGAPRYFACLKTIAEESLDWKKLGPVVAQYRALIDKEVEADTRKLESYEAFKRTTDDNATTAGVSRGHEYPLRAFADLRRKYLLEYPEIKKLPTK